MSFSTAAKFLVLSFIWTACFSPISSDSFEEEDLSDSSAAIYQTLPAAPPGVDPCRPYLQKLKINDVWIEVSIPSICNALNEPAPPEQESWEGAFDPSQEFVRYEE